MRQSRGRAKATCDLDYGMSKSHAYFSRKVHETELHDIFAFVGTLFLVSLVTILVYLLPVEFLIIATALGFVPMALYFVSHH